MQEYPNLFDADHDETSSATAGPADAAPPAAAAAAKDEKVQCLAEYFQHYVYKFDDPLGQDYAYVHVMNDRISVQLPLRQDYTQIFEPMHHVQLYLNKRLIFHTAWLSLQTLQDQVKYKNLIQQIWHEYTLLTGGSISSNNWWSSFVPLMHSEVVTTFNKPSYYLSSYENNYITSIDLEIKTTNSSPLPPLPPEIVPIHIQFYFGSNLFFCSKTDLQNVDVYTLYFILSFILQKLIN